MSLNASFVSVGRRMPPPLESFASAVSFLVAAASEAASPVELATLDERLNKGLTLAELAECEQLLTKIRALAREKAIRRQADVQRERMESAKRTLELMAEERTLARAVTLLEAPDVRL